MIVWDSREAEERNARGLLAERTAKLRKARRKARLASVQGWIFVVLAMFNGWQLAHGLTVLPVVGILLSAWGLWMWPANRRAAAAHIAWCEETLQTAQEVHDRVFGGQP